MSRTRKKVETLKRVAKGETILEIEEKDKKELEKQENQKRSLQNKLNIAFSTPEGKVALRLIKNLCGYESYDAVARMADGTIDQTSTFYNTARRSVYLDLRKLIRPSLLKETEYDNDKEH